MAIGRFRTDPAELTAEERAVVAKQHPEGALVVGMGLGIAVSMAVAPALVVVGPIVGGVGGYALGRWYRARRLRELDGSDGSGLE